jgi:hypothetical protein
MRYSVVMVRVTRFKSEFALFIGKVGRLYPNNKHEFDVIRTIVTLLAGLREVRSVWNSLIPCT